MISILNAVIARELSVSTCRRILSADGVTSSQLSISSAPGIFASLSVNTRTARNSVPEIGEAASAAKNLDEYQFLICSLVPSLPDSSPSKLEIQKYRIAIFASFAKLVMLLNENPQGLGEWSKNARWLVEETSEAYLQAKSGIQTHPIRRKEIFDYFGVPETSIIAALHSLYGQT